MKKVVLLYALVFILSINLHAQFFHESFLTDTLYEVTLGAEGKSSNADYFKRVTNDSIGLHYEGVDSFFFAGQDIDDTGWDGSDSPSQLTWSGIEISGMQLVRFEGKFAEVLEDEGDIDKSDFILLQYRIDEEDWQNLLFFHNNGSTYNDKFYLDTDFDGVGDGICISSVEGTMVQISQQFPVNGDSLALRLTVAVNSGSEDFAIDDFMLFHEQVPTQITTETYDEPKAIYLNGTIMLPFEMDFCNVYSMNGQKVLSGVKGVKELDVSKLKSGIYLLKYGSRAKMNNLKFRVP